MSFCPSFPITDFGSFLTPRSPLYGCRAGPMDDQPYGPWMLPDYQHRRKPQTGRRSSSHLIGRSRGQPDPRALTDPSLFWPLVLYKAKDKQLSHVVDPPTSGPMPSTRSRFTALDGLVQGGLVLVFL